MEEVTCFSVGGFIRISVSILQHSLFTTEPVNAGLADAGTFILTGS